MLKFENIGKKQFIYYVIKIVDVLTYYNIKIVLKKKLSAYKIEYVIGKSSTHKTIVLYDVLFYTDHISINYFFHVVSNIVTNN